MGATLHRGARASHYRGLSCCGAQAPDVQAQQLWLTGPVPPRHVGSSQTRARTRVPCIGRWILNHCTTREVLGNFEIAAFTLNHTHFCKTLKSEYYSAIKRNEIELFVVRWMDLESVIQSEVSQKEKNKYCMLTHIYGIYIKKKWS